LYVQFCLFIKYKKILKVHTGIQCLFFFMNFFYEYTLYTYTYTVIIRKYQCKGLVLNSNCTKQISVNCSSIFSSFRRP